MGKAKKLKVEKSKRHNPLAQQILENELAKQSSRVKFRKRPEADEEFVDNKLSKKILEQALEQQEELEEEYEYSSASKLSSRLQGVSLRADTSSEAVDTDDGEDTSQRHTISVPDIKVSEEDRKALELFFANKGPSETCTLGEIIKEKLTEKKTELESQFSDVGSLRAPLPEKMVPMLRGVAELFATYRTGKIPKIFKRIPHLTDWEQALELTEPDNWSSAAVYQATRIFSSNLPDHKAARFYKRVLFPRLRDEVSECKTLDFHMYQALRKSLYKATAFFTGIVIPICESGTCTLREATIISSILAKYSIPVLSSAIGILAIAEMGYTGPNSLFLRTLLEKQYALPFRVIDAVVAHFLRFTSEKGPLPLLWHQCLLTFVQHYKDSVSTEQRDELLKLLSVHCHQHVTPEIQRELESVKCSYHGTMAIETKPKI